MVSVWVVLARAAPVVATPQALRRTHVLDGAVAMIDVVPMLVTEPREVRCFDEEHGKLYANRVCLRNVPASYCVMTSPPIIGNE